MSCTESESLPPPGEYSLDLTGVVALFIYDEHNQEEYDQYMEETDPADIRQLLVVNHNGDIDLFSYGQRVSLYDGGGPSSLYEDFNESLKKLGYALF